jgi:hypothetical protein
MEPSAAVTDLCAYANARRPRRSAAATAERSQELYERIVARAEQARKRDFLHALERGMGAEQLAQAVGLELEDLNAIVGSR